MARSDPLGSEVRPESEQRSRAEDVPPGADRSQVAGMEVQSPGCTARGSYVTVT